jgi:hypothetical protein
VSLPPSTIERVGAQTAADGVAQAGKFVGVEPVFNEEHGTLARVAQTAEPEVKEALQIVQSAPPRGVREMVGLTSGRVVSERQNQDARCSHLRVLGSLLPPRRSPIGGPTVVKPPKGTGSQTSDSKVYRSF